MRPRGHRALLTVCAVSTLLAGTLATTSSAQASPDSDGPVLNVPTVSSFVVGYETADATDLGYLTFLDGQTQREYQWTASDASGICGYSVDTLVHTDPGDGDGWNIGEVDTTNAANGHYSYGTDDYDIEGHLEAIRINARDCAGNVTSVVRRPWGVNVVKDYGPTLPDGWRRTTWAGAIGDNMLKTAIGKVSLSTVVRGDGTHVALVMAKGPARGRASIYLDGSLMTTVDTYAPSNINRVVMWDTELHGASEHTIKVVNLATPGRPRIDIDAYLA